MQIREALYGDVGDIIDYMEEYHKDSNLSDIPFDRQSTSKVIDYLMASKDSTVLVAMDGVEIRGVLFGTIEPFFFNKKRSYATDLMFIADGGGPQLWKSFKDWATFHGVDRIMMGVSSEDARAGQLLEALGMKNTGGMYVLRCQSS